MENNNDTCRLPFRRIGVLMSRKTVYAGIGSRETPKPILSIMRKFAEAVAETHILRSGGAPGADQAFFEGAKSWCKRNNVPMEQKMEIFVPWDGFNRFKTSQGKHIYCDIPHGAYMIAEKYHPNYSRLREPVKHLMARNTCQIMGRLLNDSVDYVVCYTSDGKSSGGTGQALRIAEAHNITVYNLFYKDAYEFVLNIIEESKKVK